MSFFLDRVYRLMAVERIPYEEACRRVGRHGGLKRVNTFKPVEPSIRINGQEFINEQACMVPEPEVSRPRECGQLRLGI